MKKTIPLIILAGMLTMLIPGCPEPTDPAEDSGGQTPANTAPTAVAGNNVTIEWNGTAALDGSGSSDPEGDALTYAWEITASPDGSVDGLSDPTAVTPEFTPGASGEYTITLVVSDGDLESAPDRVTITVNEEPLPVLTEPVIALSSETGSAKGIQTLSISHTNGEGQIYYSLDGNDPIVSEENEFRDGEDPVLITSSATIKAVVVQDGYQDSPVATLDATLEGDLFSLTHVGDLELDLTEGGVTKPVVENDMLYLVNSDIRITDEGGVPAGYYSFDGSEYTRTFLKSYDISDNETPVLSHSQWLSGADQTMHGMDIAVADGHVMLAMDALRPVEQYSASDLSLEHSSSVYSMHVTAGLGKAAAVGDVANQSLNVWNLSDFSSVDTGVTFAANGHPHILPNGYYAVPNASFDVIADDEWVYRTGKMAVFSNQTDYVYYEYPEHNGETMTMVAHSLKYGDFILLHYHSEDPDNMGNNTIDFVDVSDPSNPHSVALLEVEPYAVMGLVGDYLVVGENNLNVYSLTELTDSTDDIYLAASLGGDHSSWGKWGFTGDVNSADEMYIYITRDDWDFSDETPVMTIVRASR